MTPALQIDPYRLESNQGEKVEAFGLLLFVKAGTEATGGKFNLFDICCPAGYVTPLHIHYAEDVAVFILEGSLTIFWGEHEKEAAAGSYLFQPHGTPHGFRVGKEAARLLYLTVPAGFDRFVHERVGAANNSDLMSVAARYKIEILGPLPEQSRA